MVSLEYLNDERKKLWEKILLLEEEIAKKTSDYEGEAKQASKKASEYRNRSEEARDTVLKYLEEATTKLEEISKTYVSLEEYSSKIEALHKVANEKAQNIETDYSDLVERKKYLETQIEEVDNYFEADEDISERIKIIEDAFTKTNDYLNKISVTHTSVIDRKQEIDKIYYQIAGYTEEQNGEQIQIKGLKDELANAYNDIKAKVQEFQKSIEEFTEKNSKDYQSFAEAKEQEYKDTIERWEKNYEALNNKIVGLLPNALTAGLSHAYSKKKDDEVIESIRLSRQFKQAIIGLVCVSFLPFIISIIELSNNKPLEKVLLDMPRFVLSILPLYIPVLWLAYSANKKQNLSKRLIEEYTHKEVLSKTYEGLTSQINSVEDKAVSVDLKNKLLYSILEISSENPGKLISDYNKSDHPVMDALDKSVKLGEAVEKLSKVPGLSKLANILDRKSNSIIEKSDKLASEGFEEISDNIKKQIPEEKLLQ